MADSDSEQDTFVSDIMNTLEQFHITENSSGSNKVQPKKNISAEDREVPIPSTSERKLPDLHDIMGEPGSPINLPQRNMTGPLSPGVKLQKSHSPLTDSSEKRNVKINSEITAVKSESIQRQTDRGELSPLFNRTKEEMERDYKFMKSTLGYSTGESGEAGVLSVKHSEVTLGSSTLGVLKSPIQPAKLTFPEHHKEFSSPETRNDPTCVFKSDRDVGSDVVLPDEGSGGLKTRQATPHKPSPFKDKAFTEYREARATDISPSPIKSHSITSEERRRRRKSRLSGSVSDNHVSTPGKMPPLMSRSLDLDPEKSSIGSLSTRSFACTDLDQAMIEMDQMKIKKLTSPEVQIEKVEPKVGRVNQLGNKVEIEETDLDCPAKEFRPKTSHVAKNIFTFSGESKPDPDKCSDLLKTETVKSSNYRPSVNLEDAVKWPIIMPGKLDFSQLEVFEGNII